MSAASVPDGPAGRLPAVVALLVLGAALVVSLGVTTPWSALRAVPGGPVPVDPARDFTVAEMAREDAFHAAVRPPAYLSLGVALALALVLGLSPLGARLVATAARPLGGGWAWQVLVGGLALVLAGRLARLPFDAWAETVLRRYGLSTQTWASWAGDVAKAFGLTTGLLLGVLLVVVALARALPATWWLPAAGLGAALVVVLSFGYPLLVEPVFNRFTPMEPSPLRSSLLELAERDGVPVREVLEADASRRTTALNAYVSGFGATRRIVVYDTLLRTASPEEVRLVVAHELGHAKRNDVLRGTGIGALGVAAAGCLLFLALGWAPLLRRAGVSGADDPRSVALLLALVAVFTTLAGPLANLVSRRIEARADVHALDLTRDPETFIRMQRRLSLSNLSDLDPHPVVYGLFASHPTAPERIALARSWARAHDVTAPLDLALSHPAGPDPASPDPVPRDP